MRSARNCPRLPLQPRTLGRCLPSSEVGLLSTPVQHGNAPNVGGAPILSSIGLEFGCLFWLPCLPTKKGPKISESSAQKTTMNLHLNGCLNSFCGKRPACVAHAQKLESYAVFPDRRLAWGRLRWRLPGLVGPSLRRYHVLGTDAGPCHHRYDRADPGREIQALKSRSVEQVATNSHSHFLSLFRLVVFTFWVWPLLVVNTAESLDLFGQSTQEAG